MGRLGAEQGALASLVARGRVGAVLGVRVVSRGSGGALLDDYEGLGYWSSGHGDLHFLHDTGQCLTVVRYELRGGSLEWMTLQKGETRFDHYNGSGGVEPR